MSDIEFNSETRNGAKSKPSSSSANLNRVITLLNQERQNVQERIFLRWINVVLKTVDKQISDIYEDLKDGTVLITLLEILSGEKLPAPSKHNSRIHCMENNLIALNFLKQNFVKVDNFGPNDIVDGNHTLILGLIWTIILRFQIQQVLIDDKYDNKPTNDQGDHKPFSLLTAKSSLLLWCQMKTVGHNNVDIVDFSYSWSNGLAFNALLHYFKPESVDFDQLGVENAYQNLKNAFECAEKYFDIPRLLEPEDLLKPESVDEKIIITYISLMYNQLNKYHFLSSKHCRIEQVTKMLISFESLNDKISFDKNELIKKIEVNIKTHESFMSKYQNKDWSLEKITQMIKDFKIISNPEILSCTAKFYQLLMTTAKLFSLETRLKFVPRPSLKISPSEIENIQELLRSLRTSQNIAESNILGSLSLSLGKIVTNSFVTNQSEILQDWINDILLTLNSIKLPSLATECASEESMKQNLAKIRSFVSTYKFIPCEVSAVSEQVDEFEQNYGDLGGKMTEDIGKMKKQIENINSTFKTSFNDLNWYLPFLENSRILIAIEKTLNRYSKVLNESVPDYSSLENISDDEHFISKITSKLNFLKKSYDPLSKNIDMLVENQSKAFKADQSDFISDYKLYIEQVGEKLRKLDMKCKAIADEMESNNKKEISKELNSIEIRSLKLIKQNLAGLISNNEKTNENSMFNESSLIKPQYEYNESITDDISRENIDSILKDLNNQLEINNSNIKKRKLKEQITRLSKAMMNSIRDSKKNGTNLSSIKIKEMQNRNKRIKDLIEEYPELAKEINIDEIEDGIKNIEIIFENSVENERKKSRLISMSMKIEPLEEIAGKINNDKHHSLKKRNDSDLSKFNMNLLSMHLSNLNDEANKLDKGTPKIESDGIKIHNRLNSLNKKLSSVDTNTIFTSSSIEMRESFSKIETELKRNKSLLKKLSSDFNDTVSKDQNNTCSLSIFKISTEIIKSESDSLDAVDFEKLDQNDKKIYSNLVKEKQKILNDLDELNLKIEEVEKAIKTDSELNNYVNQLDTVSEYNKNLKQSLNNLLEKKNVLVSTMGNDTHFELYELNDSKNKLDDNLYAVQHKIKEIESNLDVKEIRKHPILKKICNKLNVVSNEWKNIFMNVDSIGNIIEAWKNSKQYNEKLDLVASFINDSNQEISQDLTPENLTAKKIILKQFKQLLHDMRLEVTHKMLLSGSSDGEFAYACLQKVSDRIVENEWGLSATLNKLEDLSVNQLSAKPLNIFESKIKNCENIISNIMSKANNAPQFSILALKNTENVLKEIYLEGVNHLQTAKHNRFTIEKELEKINHLLKKVSTDIDLIEINYKSEGINEASGYKMLLEIEAIENFLLRGNDFLRSFPQIIKNALVDLKASKENLSVLKKKIDSNSFRDYPSLHERAISLLAKLPEILDDHIVSGSRYLNNLTLQSNKRLRNHIESVISDKIQILNKAPKFNQVLMNEAGIEEEFKDIILCYSDQRDTDSDILSKFLKDLQNRKLPLFNCEYILSLFEQISMFVKQECNNIMLNSCEHILKSAFNHRPIYEKYINFFTEMTSTDLKNISSNHKDKFVKALETLNENYSLYTSLEKDHSKLQKCGEKINFLNWMIKLRSDFIEDISINPEKDSKNKKWVDSLDFLSSITHKSSNEILDIPVKELQEELQEENAFSFTIAAWLRDSQLSWNSLFEQINSQKYKLDSHHLTSKVVYENQFLLANISVIEKHLLDLIQKHSESPAAQIPDIRKDIAGLEPTVHQSIDDARHLYSKADISSTNILKKITIKLASRYQHLYEKSKLLNFSVKLDSNWRNFQLLDVRLRQHLSNLMLKVATVSFDKNNDENIFVAQTEVQLLKATADSLQPIFDTILSLAKEMIQQKHESHSQIRQLVLSLTSKRADLMQMLEDLKIMLMDAVEISLKHHDRQIYEISETITNTQLDFLQSQCQALSSKPDLELIKNELSNIHQSEVIADLAQDEYSPLLKISPIKKKNIRDMYVVDLSSYNLNKSTEKKKYDDNKLNKLSIGNIKNIMKIKNKSKKSQNNLLTGSTTKFSHTNIDQFEGKLMHKIITFDDESDYHLKKMIKKHSWESVHCILTFGLLLVYTDGIEAEKMPEHPLYSLELIDCECARIDGSQKGKANIFSIKNVYGNFEALYQAKTAVECETWLSMLSHHSSHSNKTKNSFEESEKSAV